MDVMRFADGVIDLRGLGLKLTIDPLSLFKERFSSDFQAFLDIQIESMYKDTLNEVEAQNKEKLRFFQTEVALQEHYKSEVSPKIRLLAEITRNLLRLHSDSEEIQLTDEQRETRDFCYSVWKYDNDYGFISTEKVELKFIP